MRASNVYCEPWYLGAVCPDYRRHLDGYDHFIYHINDRGEAASTYGYPGITGDIGRIREALGRPLFIRHAVVGALTDIGGALPGATHRLTCVCPTDDPHPDGSDFAKELRRGKAAGVSAEVRGNSEFILAKFILGYRDAMRDKHAADKHIALADRLLLWAGNDRVVVVSTEHSAALFLVDADGRWAHYHLAYRGADAHGTESYAIIARAAKWLGKMGVRYIHLGGGMSDQLTDPLYRFKCKVGRLPHMVFFQEVP